MSLRSKNKLYSATISSCMLVLALGACGDDSGGDDNGGEKDGSVATGDAGRDASSPGMDGSVSARDGSTDSSTPSNRDASTDAATTADTGTPDSGTPDSGTAQIPTLNGCAAADYVDISSMSTHTITFGGTLGLKYSPKCATVSVGQAVVFSGDFGGHPLKPGTPGVANAGSPNNPITATQTGTTKTFTFAAAGTYPYYCDYHESSGMVGSIHVK